MESVRTVPLFAGLSDEDFTRLEREVEQVSLEAGARLFSEGDDGDRAYVIVEGEIEVFKESGGREVRLAVLDAGNVMGEMALLLGEPRNASVRAHTDVTLVAIHRAGFQTLLDTSATASRAMFDVLISRLRDNTDRLRKVERMAQLGTLTAGLAHELNNPAAAVKRGSGQLREAAIEHAGALTAVADAGFTNEQRSRIDEIVGSMRDRGGRPANLDAVARSDKEADLEDWLDDLGVSGGWKMAPTLVDAGLEVTALKELADDFPAEGLGIVFDLLAAEHALLALLTEVEEGATRLSAIVKALKSYSFLDQAPIQEIDVTAGLEDTLLILRSKTKNIEIKREFAPDLPRIEAFGSELNQVWTNLIDNAADAINTTERSDGKLVLRAFVDDEMFVVEVEDNGTGIPEDIQDRVFDSFFTTKEPGKGTGLGLDISYGIVVGTHHGEIKIDSHPGMTVFRVELPLRQSS